MSSSLGSRSVSAVKRLWEQRMAAQVGSLDSAATTFVEWPDFTAAVVLGLEGSLVVAGPARALTKLRDVPRRLLLDVSSVQRALGTMRPELVGKALLAYADTSTFVPAATRAREAERPDVEQVVSSCGTDERDESGLLQMAGWYVVDAQETPVAASGYEDWCGGVAHLGVAVSPAHRGKDLGRVVASAACSHALRTHTVMQWRSRNTNVASTRLGERLGFAQVGTQLTFDLHDLRG